MLAEIDHLVRNLIPCFAEAAGMKTHADRLRALPMIRNASTIQAAATALRAFGKSSPGPSREPIWADLIRDVAFWAEASLWTAAENNQEDCPTCVLFVKRELDAAFSHFAEH